MFHRNLHLTPESSDFIRSRIESGRYENVHDLLRAALRALQREEMKSSAMRPEGGVAESDAYRKLWEASDPFRQLPR
jgi:putative addiction module CopG family antidote